MKKLLLALILGLSIFSYSQGVSPDIKSFTITQGAVLSDSARIDYALVPVALMLDSMSVTGEIEIQVAFGDNPTKRWHDIKAQAGYDSVYAVLIGSVSDTTANKLLPLDLSIMATLLGTYALDFTNETVWIRLKTSASLFPYEGNGIIRMRLRYL